MGGGENLPRGWKWANRKRREDTIEELSGRKQSLPFDKMRGDASTRTGVDGGGDGGRGEEEEGGIEDASFVFEFFNVLRWIYRREKFYYHGINRN